MMGYFAFGARGLRSNPSGGLLRCRVGYFSGPSRPALPERHRGLLKDPGVLLKDPGVLVNDPGAL